tara:strand:+ start:220 stop:1863 length:1644 start_codon:yes stop_codon:yes gene_type:complete
MKTIYKKEDLLSIPKQEQDKHNDGFPIFKRCEISIQLYFELLIKDKHLQAKMLETAVEKFFSDPEQIIDPNDKCNRDDKGDIKKKQGILTTIFKNRPLPDLSLIVKQKWRLLKDGRSECTVAAVNDGGHRSRTILEFMLGKFKTGSNTVFHSKNGQIVNIGNMTYKEIEKEYPLAIEQLKEYKLALVIQWNLDAKQRKEDFDNRNTVTIVKEQEGRNAFDDNLIADAVRNTTRKVDGEIEPNPVHNLYKNNIFTFPNSRMVYDEIVAKIMKMISESDEKGAKVDLSQGALDEFYLKGSYAGTDTGEYVVQPKVFEKLKKETYFVLDFLYGVLTNWPTKIYPVEQHVVHALLRWYFQYKKDIQNKHMTLIYDKKLVIDYKVFAKKFALEVMKKNVDDKSVDVWTTGEKKQREKGDAFKGYLGQFNTGDKTQKSIDWIMESFYSVVASVEDEKKFGLTHFDSRPAFKQDDIINRWLDLGEKDDLGNSIEDDDIEGDHDIPRSWGVVRGGITCPETNMRILHRKDNNKKSNKMTFNEFKESLQNETEKAA